MRRFRPKRQQLSGVEATKRDALRVGQLALAALAALQLTHSARAGTNTFSAGTSWNTNGDWSSNATPTTTDALLFSTTFPLTTTLDGNFTADTLSFNNSGTMAIDANASGATARTLTLNNTATDANGTLDIISLLGGSTVNMGVTNSKGTLTLALAASTNNINVADGSSLALAQTPLSAVRVRCFPLRETTPEVLPWAAQIPFRAGSL